jgi:hypothetical protein
MKCKFLFTVLILFVINSVNGQDKSTLYKADQWLDIKGKGLAKAYSNPERKKAEVILSISSIKVTLGTTKYDYKLISFYRFSAVQWRYVVSRDNRTFEIVISEHRPEEYSIGIDGEWMVTPITDVRIKE